MNPSVEELFADNCVGDPQMPSSPSCVADRAQGFMNYIEAISCSVCEHCPNNCNAATNCM